MKKIFLILILLSNNSWAGTLTIPAYQTNGTVTAANLNSNFNAGATVVNGGLDNTNANTTNGFRFYETLSTLPTTGLAQGRAVFLTSDNTWNIYTGSAWIKDLVTVLTSPTSGQVIAYNGTNWVNSNNTLSSVSDYGTSLTTSTAKNSIALKIVYGTTTSAIGTSACVTVTNLPFTSTSSFVCTVSGNETVSGSWVGGIGVGNASASSINICNNDGSRTIKATWECQGT